MSNESDDFVVHPPSKNSERNARATNFLVAFNSGFSEFHSANLQGFNLIDQGQRQPDGISCYFAVSTAAARGMGTTSEPFQTTVRKLVTQAKQLGIINEWGVSQTYETEITSINSSIGIQPEFDNYFPNDMTPAQAKELGTKTAAALAKGFGIALLIPSRRHYILIHNNLACTLQGFDPLTGHEEPINADTIALAMANIVDDEMVGEKYSANGFVILKPAQPKDSDFKVHAIR